MALTEEFLKEIECTKRQCRDEKISLFSYLGQLPSGALNNVELLSKILFNLLFDLYDSDFTHDFLTILKSIKKHHFVDITSSYRIYIQDHFLFQIILINAIKYDKQLFIDKKHTVFLLAILDHILECSSATQSDTIHLLKLLEMILKKREDLLTEELSNKILNSMIQIASSPFPSIKHYAQNINRVVLKSLHTNDRKILCNLINLPINGIDLNDILVIFTKKQIKDTHLEFTQRVLEGFQNNTSSRNSSFFYNSLLSAFNFEDFTKTLWPLYFHHLQQLKEKGEFYQSLLKYWIPITVKHYQSAFYIFIRDQQIDFILKADTLLEIRKRGFYCNEFNVDTILFLKNVHTSETALKIVCNYTKKTLLVETFEIEAIKWYFHCYQYTELSAVQIKVLKQLFSQIFLTSHIALSKNNKDDFRIYLIFFRFLHDFCQNRINTECCEVAAQIYKIIWDIATSSSSQLVCCFKIDLDNVYEKKSNLFYQYLQKTLFWESTFREPNLINKINQFLAQLPNCPHLVQLVIDRYLKITNFQNIFPLFVQINNNISLQNSEKMRIYANLITAYNQSNRIQYAEDLGKIKQIFKSNIKTIEIEQMYQCVLVLDILLMLKQHENLDLVPFIEDCFAFFEVIFKNSSHESLHIKATKVLEALINNALDCVVTSEKQWCLLNKTRILEQLCQIIQKSNLKRPVSISINVVQKLANQMEHDTDNSIKTKLFDRTLHSLYNRSEKKDMKMRRDPETRLVIHALSLSKPNSSFYLKWAVNFIIRILADPRTPSSTLSSSLHTLEVLISDNSIHQLTLPFIPEIIKQCISVFNNTNWNVRNADLQLMKALIERFLGVFLHQNQRPKTIQDIFLLFPELEFFFFALLSQEELSDSAMMVFLFFSESHIQNYDYSKTKIARFRKLFVDVIQKYSNNFGVLAIKSFTAICNNDELPQVYVTIVDYIQRNYCWLERNIFRNFIQLLRELHRKAIRNNNDKSQMIVNANYGLISYLKKIDEFYFNLLPIQLSEPKLKLTNSDWENRILWHNYLHVVNEFELGELCDFLKTFLFLDLDNFLHVQMLSHLVDRPLKDNQSVLNEIMNLFILKVTQLEDVDLIQSYSKTFLLLHRINNHFQLDSDLIDNITNDSQTEYIYKIIVYITALKDFDKNVLFISHAVAVFKKNLHEEDILCDLSRSVGHLYQLNKTCARLDVLKIVFYLLLRNSTCLEMCSFIGNLTKARNRLNPLESMQVLLSYETLLLCLNNEKIVIKFLLECYYYISTLCIDEESITYYLQEQDISVPQQYIKRMIKHSICTFAL